MPARRAEGAPSVRPLNEKFMSVAGGVAPAAAWATGTSPARNPRFVRELESKTGKDAVLLLLCRIGKRSVAAEAATKADFTNVFNILEGFEAELIDPSRIKS